MNRAALSCLATPNSAGGAPLLPNFWWDAPLLQGALLFCWRRHSCGGALPLRGASLFCHRHPFSSYGAPLFAWAPLFCSERGTTLLLLGHSPSAGVALPLPQGHPSCAEYTPFLLVMRRPSSTGGAHLLLGRLSSAGNRQLGVTLLLGEPNFCWRRPISAEPLLCRRSSAQGALSAADLLLWDIKDGGIE